MIQPLFTPGAMRALQLATTLAGRLHAPCVEPAHLLWGLVLDESRGAEILAAHGLPRENVLRLLPLAPDLVATELTPAEAAGKLSEELQGVLIEARRHAALLGNLSEIGSEHLLCGLAATPSVVQEMLAAHGLEPAAAVRHSLEHAGHSLESLPVESPLSLPAESSADAADTLRILDAAANRAREGLRVVEDYVRFTLDDRHLTSLLKNWRHALAAALSTIAAHGLVSSRDTTRDVGTSVKTRREGLRETLLDVVTANFKRVQEAVRTLEEFGKVFSPELGRRLEELRYELYTLEKAVFLTHSSRERLEGRELYVLVSSELCPHGSGPVIAAALAGGAGIIQVREKNMSDRELVTYGRFVREWTARAGALFIMNDRPDLAVLTDADGVHVGQEELPVREARRIVGPTRLVGVSTHTIEQARQAVLDGADYIGVGPVFSSTTKSFAHLAGLEFVRQVADEITLPAYAIGGINLDNIDDVLAAGARRITVSSAICSAPDPADAARRLLGKVATLSHASD
ncbi:MAG: thiamine phosphate synthase [Deltaproteobacteria bacterium]